MNIMKLVLFAALSTSSSICFGVVSRQIDLNQYLSHNGKYLNGVGGPALYITDTEDVFEYYTIDFSITNRIKSITYDVTYTADKLTTDPTFDLLAFRMFPENSWITHWGSLAQDVARTDFEPRVDKSESVKIDLEPFQGSDVAMGWAFISDVPSLANIMISDIRIEAIDAPGTVVLLGTGLLATLPLARKRKSTLRQAYRRSDASCRSGTCSSGSPKVRLTLRPRITAGRAAMSSAQRLTFLYSCTDRNSPAP